ncbi:TGACG-sequence-specific DNA-binding protein TGA-2.1-like [Cucurbita moschata]|uniref:TGACG-sequence-specific DNA-binding protein TGA-2.1-like n=1 Tax=Cucurbita moschata TaxID=3662 RepID=A0A6J1F513_CUCMO|nr:TGACG-sequence-specific DNA-binding protein TGA-2.1-like [Cucurbita moschata]
MLSGNPGSSPTTSALPVPSQYLRILHLVVSASRRKSLFLLSDTPFGNEGFPNRRLSCLDFGSYFISLPELSPLNIADAKFLHKNTQHLNIWVIKGMDASQQSLAETLASGTPATSGSSGNVVNYMGQMAMAMGKLGTLDGFLRQADNLRQQTLQQMHRILTTRQSARALLAINDYFSRLRALSSLWLARPRE